MKLTPSEVEQLLEYVERWNCMKCSRLEANRHHRIKQFVESLREENNEVPH